MSERYTILKRSDGGYLTILGILLLLVLAGLVSAHDMESDGHWITGMNNQVVWGLPHVFALLLILSASGALNIGSMSSVFNQQQYKPWVRFSGILSITLLTGGLLILVLDLGRPDRLIVAITHYNFKSIFAWNVFLYTGFIVIVVVYLWFQFEKTLNRFVNTAGLLALIWRLMLTSGSGGIFGFLVARQLYDAAMMVPVFIVLSLSLGTAVFLLVRQMLSVGLNHDRDVGMLAGSGRLLGIFAALELFLVLAFHLTRLYSAERQGIEYFILFDGGIYTLLFWLGQVGLGACLPVWLLFFSAGENVCRRVMIASGSIITGAVCQLYVLIIGGQVYPQLLFPGKTVSSTFYDGVVAHYSPAPGELFLGLGGVALAILILLGSLRILPFLPENHP